MTIICGWRLRLCKHKPVETNSRGDWSIIIVHAVFFRLQCLRHHTTSILKSDACPQAISTEEAAALEADESLPGGILSVGSLDAIGKEGTISALPVPLRRRAGFLGSPLACCREPTCRKCRQRVCDSHMHTAVMVAA